MCCLLLVCIVLKTLHTVKHILNEEECRSVGKAGGRWRDDLAVVIAVKPHSAVQETLGSATRDYEVQRWSNGLGGHDRGSQSTQIQLLTELVRRQS